jgi:hypothetical protein
MADRKEFRSVPAAVLTCTGLCQSKGCHTVNAQ